MISRQMDRGVTAVARDFFNASEAEKAAFRARLEGARQYRDKAMRYARQWQIAAHVCRHPVERDRARQHAAANVRDARRSNRIAVTLLRAISA